jgi:Cu(I)/Ag(I) efflux system membrane fusion protein
VAFVTQPRRIVLGFAVVAALAASYLLGRHSQRSQGKSAHRILYYVDPMHPAYISDKPGVAPDCGMPLEPVYADQPSPHAAAMARAVQLQLPAGAVSIEPSTQHLLGIRVAAVEKGDATHIVRAVGRVAPEDTRIYRVNSGVDGFIRETFHDSVGTQVKKDQTLATYYSPDFLAVASGFLAASERVPGANGNDGARTVPFPGTVAKQGVSSLQGYSDRLRNLGMSDVQIKRIAEARQLPENIDVVSPVDGFILSRNVSAGLHFDHSMEFYRIADLARVWVVAEISEQDASYVHSGGQGQIVLNDSGPRLAARISDSLPQSEAGGGSVKLRLEVDNPGFILRPEMLVDVELPSHLPPGVTIPVDALVDSGSHVRVYVQRSQGVFEPREVQAGWRSAERVEILKGLAPGEQVVVGATFLVDSESRLKNPMQEGGLAPEVFAATHQVPAHSKSNSQALESQSQDPSCGMEVDQAKAAAAGNTVSFNGATYYFCSSRCKEKFQNSPAAWASRRSGAGK